MRSTLGLAIAASLAVSGVSVAALTFNWSGSADSNWHQTTPQDNWTGAGTIGLLPGTDAGRTDDIVVIANPNNSFPVVLSSGLNAPLTSVRIDADATNADVKLNVTAAQSNTLGNLTMFSAGADVATLDADATLTVSSLTVTGENYVEVGTGVTMTVTNAITINNSSSLQITGSGTNPRIVLGSFSNASGQPLTFVGPITFEEQ